MCMIYICMLYIYILYIYANTYRIKINIGLPKFFINPLDPASDTLAAIFCCRLFRYLAPWAPWVPWPAPGLPLESAESLGGG